LLANEAFWCRVLGTADAYVTLDYSSLSTTSDECAGIITGLCWAHIFQSVAFSLKAAEIARQNLWMCLIRISMLTLSRNSKSVTWWLLFVAGRTTAITGYMVVTLSVTWWLLFVAGRTTAITGYMVVTFEMCEFSTILSVTVQPTCQK